ncbi:hypothetical protein Gbem_3027 [Citrifermentans bemidjiense Bem]|uniref:Uncharacterized protein n=1 Tax=Citrifermentans bemidjiense (strain ATCC BAA-1014 / DSM 16622 / JCM 12645 / Bem) TaxID=404380 RepID=B5E860_CITBB|nr:hypothetical protein Gbem_3027 [Citrifermentans bemidjiense Bem]
MSQPWLGYGALGKFLPERPKECKKYPLFLGG